MLLIKWHYSHRIPRIQRLPRAKTIKTIRRTLVHLGRWTSLSRSCSSVELPGVKSLMRCYFSNLNPWISTKFLPVTIPELTFITFLQYILCKMHFQHVWQVARTRHFMNFVLLSWELGCKVAVGSRLNVCQCVLIVIIVTQNI